MASSSSQTSESIQGPAIIRRLNDAVYEFHTPALGFINLDIVFFHGFQAQGSKDAYLKTWMLADDSACWLNTWLPATFPKSRILSVSYDSSTEVTCSEGRMDIYLVGENLARSIIELAAVGQSCPVVFVGHGVGGMVLKEVCCRAEHLGLKAEGSINPYSNFLRRMKGAFFFSTPQLGTRVEANPTQRSPLLKYYELLSTEGARLISAFQGLRNRYGWKTFGLIEASMTETSKTVIRIPSLMTRLFGSKPQRSPLVEEGSGRLDVDDFSVLSGEDSSSICKPTDRNSTSYQHLLQFLQGILTDEEWALDKWKLTLQFPRGFIGMPERVRKVLETLQLGQAEPSRVSLVGMSGIGKSTLAKEVLVEIRSEFDFVCFVDDVKSRLKQHQLHTLILENLHSRSGSKIMLHDVNAQQSLWRLLKGKKVLMIMDNVDSEEQINTLLIPDWLEKGSRLIATSQVLSQELMPSFIMHEVPFLSTPEAERLFRAHVDTEVIRGIPNDIFRQIVAQCDGLPLTVEVIGSYLRLEGDVSIWKDSLGPSERNMFLDLAVFDKCEPREIQYDLHIWRMVWEAGANRPTVSSGLRNLVEKCFIRTFQESNVGNQRGKSNLHYLASSSSGSFVYIHQQLRDMGRSISRDKKIELCRGVWKSDGVNDLLVKYEGDNAHTELLSVAQNQNETPLSTQRFSWSSIGQLRELRLLRMSNVGLIGDGSQRFSFNLTFLEMSACFRVKARTPFDFLKSDCWPIRAEDVGGLDRLTVLILEECLNVHFPNNFHELRNLRILMISGEQVKKLPKKFGLLPSLQVLFLEHVGLSEFPHSFSQLSSLQILKLSNCSALKTLPDCPISQSTLLAQDVFSPLCMLQRLILEDLPTLTEMPASFGMLISLEELFIQQCSGLSKLPESFGMLISLEELFIQQCSGLSKLPESFGMLISLEELFIQQCSSLSKLPESFGMCHKLKQLTLSRCDSLESLCESFGKLESLYNLDIIACRRLQRLPNSLGNLKNLVSLTLLELRSLKGLPESMGQMYTLPSLIVREHLNLQRSYGSVGLRRLKNLFIVCCESLESLPKSD